MIYVIEKVREKNGAVHERELRRKGHRVTIESLCVEQPLFYRYVTEGSLVITSTVEAFNTDWESEGHLVVQTRNSVYCFRKES